MTTLTAANTLDKLIEAGFPFRCSTLWEPSELEVECEFDIDSWGCASNGWDEPGEAAEFHIIDVRVTNKDDELIHTIVEMTPTETEWLESHFNDEIQQKCAEYDGGDDYDG